MYGSVGINFVGEPNDYVHVPLVYGSEVYRFNVFGPYDRVGGEGVVAFDGPVGMCVVGCEGDGYSFSDYVEQSVLDSGVAAVGEDEGLLCLRVS